MASFKVGKLSPDLNFGRIVQGLTSEHIKDQGVRNELRTYWIEDGLVLFRDGEVSENFHLALSRIFGELRGHPTYEIEEKNKPELITLYTTPDNTTLVELDGVEGSGFLGWHKDLVYMDEINHGGILRALKVAKAGGLTGYIDQIDAYERLPGALKARIEGLSVVYRLGPFEKQKYMTRSTLRVLRDSPAAISIFARLDRDFPPVAHPLVFVQPETGRKVLNLSPQFAMYVEGMDADESHELLGVLSGHILDGPAYFHQWSTQEMILWDNWRMLHSVTPAPLNAERIMQRTTIKGDYGAGRKLPFPAAAE